jgi:hypothetical protein
MVPTAEAARNDGGKLLLKQHEYYSQRAKTITEFKALYSNLPAVRPDVTIALGGTPTAKKCDRPDDNSRQKDLA